MGILTCLLLVFVVPSMGQNSFSNKIILNNGIFNVSWNFNASLDTFEFLLEVRTTGWIGFGFALNAPTNMMNYDVAVGGVLSNGTTYLQDYYTTGRSRPDPDPQQDFIVINGSEQNGVTSLTFNRRRNTTDALDVAIQPGMPIFLVWAYHPSVDAQPMSSFSQHPNDARGVMQQTLIPAAITPTPTPAMATPAITATPVVEVRPMHFANFLQLDNNGNYNVSWVYNNSMDTLHFMVEVKTTGWIGFGVATQAPNMMINYDVAVGGVSGGAGYLWDYLTVGRRQPQLDLQQDWMLTYFREENNVTTLRFYRQRDTNDSANDTVIQPGMPIFLVWAYHPSVDAQPSSFPQHPNDARGVIQQTLIPAAITPTPTPATPVVEVRPMHFANFLQLDNNGNYNVSWVYNNSMDTLHFMVEVKTTGWIGFGVATQAPNMMMNYDVAVGGVSGGAGYLWDYLTVGRRLPQLDLQEDWRLTYSREENNVTTLRFYRQRDTNDSANDTVIQVTKVLFMMSITVNYVFNVFMLAMATPAITATPVVDVRPMHFANFLQLDNNGDYNVSWVYNNSMDTLHFMVEVKTTGWIGFGVATQAPNMMMNYDVAVGGVSGGAGYLWDYLTVGRRQPQLDLQQDLILTYSREENSVTTLRFYRQRDTNDSANDTVIQPGMPIFLVWAYHPSVDAQPSSFSGHSNDARGVMQQTLIPAAITPTPTPATATPAITATPVVDVRPMHFANFLQLDNNGDYNVSWVYNNSMDTLHFMVEVKTTGWIGFGVATQAPNMMMNYDVAVGGVSGGAGYLWDYLTVGRRQPQLDLQQDWMLSYFREENSVTTLRFYRRRDTNDSPNDIVIQPGMSIFLVWAYHRSVDAQSSSFPQHPNDARGVMQQTLIPAAITTTPTP
ncbi:unnamed protein product, partial [Porites lobata]